MVYSNALGYVFEARTGLGGTLGVVESHKYTYSCGYPTISVTCGIDATGTPLIPAYLTRKNKIVPLLEYDKDMSVFVAGKMRTLSKFGDFMLLVDAKLYFEPETGEYIPERSVIDFYVPRQEVADMYEATGKGGNTPAIVCDKLNTKHGVHTYKVSESTLEGYTALFARHHNFERMHERLGYLEARCEQY